MTTGGSHLESTFHTILSFYISEIEFKMTLMLIKLLTRIDDCGFKLLLTIQEINHIDDAVHPIHINVVNYGSLTDILFWNNQPLVFLGTCLHGYGQGTTNRLQPTVESQLADKHILMKMIRKNFSTSS